MSPSPAPPEQTLGVAIAAFRSAEVIGGCLDSLLASEGPALKVVVVDNASPDDTREVVRKWAAANAQSVSFEEREAGEAGPPEAWLTLVKSPVNGGFAHACNRALKTLAADPAIDLFWLLNPDARARPDTAAHYLSAADDGPFALMGGRTVFAEQPDTVQTDGGRVSRWTGVVESVNWGVPINRAEVPRSDAVDFITGANVVASRRFLEEVGPMVEDYFLYYEEVDWAFRRGKLPLRQVPQAQIDHIGGTAIGTGSLGRRPSAFANYFNYRNRIRFLKRFQPLALPSAYAFAFAKAAQLLLLGARGEATALLRGLLGLSPPDDVAEAIAPEARAMAFGEAAP